MTVTTHNQNTIFCLSTDIKPTLDNRSFAYLSNTVLYETDTGHRFILNDDSTWIRWFPATLDLEFEIAKGNVPGHSFIHKFGKAADFDIADGFVTVWDGADDSLVGNNDGTGSTAMQYTYSATADITKLSSDSAADTVSIKVIGLASDYTILTQYKTLTGTTPVTLDTPLIRVFRLINVGSSNLVGNVFVSVTDAVIGTGVAGQPDDLTDIRAMITIGHNQTLMSVYTVPAGKTAYMSKLNVSLAGAKKTSVHIFHLKIRPFGQVFQTKHTGAIIAVGSSNSGHPFDIQEVITAKSDIEIHANTDEDVAAISAGYSIQLVDD